MSTEIDPLLSTLSENLANSSHDSAPLKEGPLSPPIPLEACCNFKLSEITFSPEARHSY